MTKLKRRGRLAAAVTASVIALSAVAAVPADAAVQSPWGASANGNAILGSYHYNGTTVWNPQYGLHTGQGASSAVSINIARINTWDNGLWSPRTGCARALGGKKAGFHPIPDGVWSDGYCYAI